MDERKRGTVKAFEPHRGWGLIEPAEGGAELKFDREHTTIDLPRFFVGQKVSYTLVHVDKVPEAYDVKIDDEYLPPQP